MMEEFTEKKWMPHVNKYLRNKRNREFVTGRVHVIKNKFAIKFSIGLVVADIISLKKGDMVEVLIHKKNRNLFILRKTLSPERGYMLSGMDPKHKSNKNFLTFEIRYEYNEQFRISQTIILDYEFNDQNLLLINLSKLKWGN